MRTAPRAMWLLVLVVAALGALSPRPSASGTVGESLPFDRTGFVPTFEDRCEVPPERDIDDGALLPSHSVSPRRDHEDPI